MMHKAIVAISAMLVAGGTLVVALRPEKPTCNRSTSRLTVHAPAFARMAARSVKATATSRALLTFNIIKVSAANAAMLFYNTGYRNLTNVAYGTGAVSEIFLQPLNGRTVVLNSLDLGAWSQPKAGGLTIVDGSNNVLFSTGSITIGMGSNHFTFDNVSSTTSY